MVDTSTLGFALAAGLVAALNPCGFAMLPSYLTLVVLGTGERQSRSVVVARALAATVAMAAGFLVVLLGLIVAPLASQVQRYLPIVTIVIGTALLGLGGWMLAGREITLLLPKSGKGAPSTALRSMFGYGLAYAIASLSCTIGPFLAVTGATFRAGSVVGGALAYLAYAVGMALVVGVLAAGIALVGTGITTRVRRLLPHVNRIGGGLLVLVGLYVGYYGIYETRLYFGGGDASDPVIDAAAAAQQTVAGWVDTLGVVPFLAALVIIVLAAVGLRRRRRRKIRPHTGMTYAAGDACCVIASRRSRRACARAARATASARAGSAAVTSGSAAIRSNRAAFRSYQVATSSADVVAAGIARSSAPISLSTVSMAVTSSPAPCPQRATVSAVSAVRTCQRPDRFPVSKRLSSGRQLAGASGVAGCSVGLRCRRFGGRG
jgi:cytochrome c biogenesis protein CcdA